MSYHTILFDLDGTVTDSQEGITKSVAYALAHFGIHVEDLSSLRKFIGPPLSWSFPQYYGLSEADTGLAVVKYRERFTDVGWAENTVYPGVEAMLDELQRAGKRLILATSKPEVQALRIMDHFGLSRYFDHICGPALDAPAGYGKADVIRDALRRAGLTGTEGVVMVGDRHHDVEGAHSLGLPCVGVLYGYGDREELTACGADRIVEDVEALRAVLLG